MGDILNVPVIEGNLITSPQPPPPASVRNRTEAEQQGHINHKKDSPGSKITLTTLSEQHPVVTVLYPDEHIRSRMLSSCLISVFFFPLLICPSLSFRMNQTSLLLFLSSHSFTFLSFISFPPCSHSPPPPRQPSLSVLFPGFQFHSMHTFCLRLITSLMEPLY